MNVRAVYAQVFFDHKERDMERILVIGSGGREAAMTWKLKQADAWIQVFCAPGNAGVAGYATCVDIKATDIDALVSFAQDAEIALTIVGPEAPLVDGIVDRFREAGLLICGPTASAARAEGSKAWFKQLLAQHEIPTAAFEVFTDQDEALAHIAALGAENIVIKADGLMGGKGVTLPRNIEEAAHDLEKLMVPGSAGETVVIEERLAGVERSAMAITDGKTVHMLPFTQDYKREGNGDTGLNTGGMGAHTLLLSQDEEEQLSNILQDVVEALSSEAGAYTGFIYLGFMMTPNGPRVLEANVRLGDPETQAILPVIADFPALCRASAEGELALARPSRIGLHALSLVLASEAYPAASDRDDLIAGIDEAQESGALVFHAGTGCANAAYTTKRSGRVLNVVGLGDTLAEARRVAYNAAEKIYFRGMKYRTDIGQE